MLKEIELKNQNTFFKYDYNHWYDSTFEFQIEFIGSKKGICNFSSFDEVDGKSTEFIKQLKDLNDLKDTYELLTGSEFE